MVDVFINNGVADSVKAPETAMEVSNHPVTKRRGRFFVRTGRPMQVWDPQEKRLKWVQHSEVQPVKAEDDATFVIVNDGYMAEADFDEVRAEMLERRNARRRNRPTLAPRADIIKEACREVMFQKGNKVTVGDVTFERPSRGMLIPRDQAWAAAMAEESKTSWDTKLKPGSTRRYG